MAGYIVNELPFIKMHGAGNDYAFIDGFATRLPDNPSRLALAVSHRHFGIGADGLVLLIPPPDNSSDVEMRMWNADGSEGSMCGNAVRCVALWMCLEGRMAGPVLRDSAGVSGLCRVKTASRLVVVTTVRVDVDQQFGLFCVDHGVPEFEIIGDEKQEVFLVLNTSQISHPKPLNFVSLSMGNPHAVFVVDEITDQLVREIGPIVETHDRFSGGTNVDWVRVVNRRQIEVRVWERGSGETLACGSGACAAVVACVNQGLCDRNVDVLVELPGGRLTVRWAESGNVFLTGPAAVSFQGVWGGATSIQPEM